MPAMLDTNVLVYAMSPPVKDSASDLAAMRRDSRALLFSSGAFCISALTLVEFAPYLRPNERAEAEKLLQRVDVIGISIEAASLAAKLIEKHSTLPSICRACLGYLKATPCKHCKASISKAQGFNDFIIIASAAVEPNVTVLYTYDDRPELAKAVRGRVEIQRPPNANGPMYAALAEQGEEDESCG
jgi:predicted nucleic acid-binding protein